MRRWDRFVTDITNKTSADNGSLFFICLHIFGELFKELFGGFCENGITLPHKAAGSLHWRFKRDKAHLAVAADVNESVKGEGIAHALLDHYRGVVDEIYLGNDIGVGSFFADKVGYEGVVIGLAGDYQRKACKLPDAHSASSGKR